MKLCDRCRVAGCLLNYGGKACKNARKQNCPDVVFTNADRVREMNDEELAKFMLSNDGAAYCKNYSAQVLKANMKIVGATEFAVVLYRDKLPKFRNVGEDGGKHMVFDWFRWERDSRKEYPKIHPTQKPVGVLKRLIEVFTDPGDVVIDPVAGSGTTLRAAYELGRSAYGFEVDKSFYEAAREKMLAPILAEKTTI